MAMVHAVPRGQVLPGVQLAQSPPSSQKCVRHPAGVQASPPWRQKPLVSHVPLAQSEPVAHGSPLGSAQTPPLHVPLAHSEAAVQAAQWLAEQRPLPQATSSAQASPMASLQKPP
jgi:hypothetical protein